MIKYIYVNLMIIMNSYTADVRMGFEVEVKNLSFTESTSSSEPYMTGNSWVLFTDQGTEFRHDPEFSTISGLKFEDAVNTAKEVEDVLLGIVDRINGVVEVLGEYREFRIFMEHRYKELKKIFKIIGIEVGESLDSSINIFVLETSLRTLYKKIHLSNSKTTTIQNLDNLIKLEKDTANDYFDILIKPYLNKYPFVLDILDNQICLDLTGENKYLNHYIESNVSGFILKKAYTNEIESIIKRYVSESFKINDKIITNITTNKKGKKIEIPEDVERALEILKNYADKIQYDFDTNSPINGISLIRNFSAFCEFKYVTSFDTESSEIESYSVCLPNEVKLGIQLTYQFKISSIMNLLRFYASYSDNLEYEDAEVYFNKRFIPISMVKYSNCLVNGESCLDFPYLNKNYVFSQLWKKKRIIIQDHISDFYNSRSLSHDAEGLFYLVLSYGLRIFNKNEIETHSNEQLKVLPYGPKKNLLIMSRVSFLELYENLKHDKDLFVELIELLCDYSFTNEDYLISMNPEDRLCSKMILTKYELIDGYDFDEERYNNTNGINFIDWIKSIINTEYQLKNQPKIMIQPMDLNNDDSLNDSELVTKSSDIISPPPGFGNEIINIKDYEGKIDIYGMGAYTGIKEGYLLAEFRSYSSLNITANLFNEFITNHAGLLYDLLEVDETILDFNDYKNKVEENSNIQKNSNLHESNSEENDEEYDNYII